MSICACIKRIIPDRRDLPAIVLVWNFKFAVVDIDLDGIFQTFLDITDLFEAGDLPPPLDAIDAIYLH